MNFNSHAHVERDEKIRVDLPKATISTHTLTWSVTFPYTEDTGMNLYFNSHAHVERDFYFGTQFSKNGNFNSHAHVERDPTCS